MRRTVWIVTGCALAILFALLLAAHTSYQPGALIAAHEQLSVDCAACHKAWRGPANARCINCHGNIADNPHSNFDVSETDIGLLPGKRLAVSADNTLACLSCHSEHRGRIVDVRASDTFACAFCHKHPSIKAVPEHLVPAMQRNFFARHLFAQPFNHYKHRLLMTSAYPPRPGGFDCVSCHLVDPAKPGAADQMSFKWSGCAGSGCHIAPQDSFMQMPASVGPSPLTIAYSGVVRFRHINAVFNHSATHLQSPCEQCHFRMNDSRNPKDSESLAIQQCFTCHAHQPAHGRVAAIPAAVTSIASSGVALAAQAPPDTASVIACGGCHLFHTYGVVPLRDFPNSAPQFPPGRKPHLMVTFRVPRLTPSGLTISPITIKPWWIGLLAFGFIAIGARHFVHIMPGHRPPPEAMTDVAPQHFREIPALDDTYQSNVRNLYIIGEAAGTASINLAMRTGRQVIDAIANQLKRANPPAQPELYDVVIVGCGPAGLGATATAKAAGLKYATLEKMTPASTLRQYPRAKFVQATPIDIAEYGSFFLEGDNSREQLIDLWDKIISQAGLVINDREEVVDVRREGDLFAVVTARNHVFRSRSVVLAIGVRGNPRHLNLSGEEPSRVYYNLIEPGEFTRHNILVVGGGNAGAEVVQALAAPQLGNTVSYSFRASVLGNVTRENVEQISGLSRSKVISVFPASAIAEIKPDTVVLEPVLEKGAANSRSTAALAGNVELKNDIIFAMIGAELPVGFLRSIGVKMVTKGRWQS